MQAQEAELKKLGDKKVDDKKRWDNMGSGEEGWLEQGDSATRVERI